MWVEHGRCGRCLGVHEVNLDLERGAHIMKSNRPRESLSTPSSAPRRPGVTGPITTPHVMTGFSSAAGSDKTYARIFCLCVPDGHVEKMSVDKVAALYVTFPEWKWGRHINLPVVTI
jgi:hypothetical protein